MDEAEGGRGGRVIFVTNLDEAGPGSLRAACDARLIEHVRTRTGRIIDSQNEVGGWPALRSGPVPADTDHDGMPDAWETAHGLDPRNPADAIAVAKSGYTNIEEYLNSLAAQ